MLYELTLCGSAQSGKTSLALVLLERLYSLGICVAYVQPTKKQARHVSQRTSVPCFSLADAINSPNEHWRVVVVDDFEHCPSGEIDALRRALSPAPWSTRLILVETRNPPDA